MPAEEQEISSLPDVLRECLIPWAQEGVWRRMIVAKPVMTRRDIPESVQFAHCGLKGKRVATRDKRLYANGRAYSARWPEAGMQEAEVPKLICVVSGTCDFQVGEYKLRCDAGHFIFLPPHTPHPDAGRSHLEGDNSEGHCDLLHIVAYQGGFHCWFCHSHGAKHTGTARENFLIADSMVNRLYGLLAEELQRGDDPQVCDGLFHALMAALYREVTMGRYLHPGPVKQPRLQETDAMSFAQQVEIYLKEHLNENLTLDVVARHLYMSRAMLVRRMRQEVGMTFVEFLSICRVDAAKRLLEQSEWSVKAIAQFVGFKSAGYFCTFFRRQTGWSPLEFRDKSHQKKR